MLDARDAMAKKNRNKPKGPVITLPYKTHKPREDV